ncbi:MAG: outer membrane beta-barrel protein [Oligoflexia bacterium]|nr:outer membrane beta-barrel protein [Oligoflexia bacterium]
MGNALFFLVPILLSFETVAFADEPFAFGDFTWLNGNSRETVSPLDTPYFTPEVLFDSNYVYDFAEPQDHTLSGSTTTGRTNEFQVQQIGVGGDFHYQNVRARIMTQFGMYSTMNPRDDGTATRGQWSLTNAYRYLSEASAGYHWNVWSGINLDAGIFLSYIGLESYYNIENWNYQMSYISANTPWFFNGVRLQTFPTDRFKAEFWLVNGWESYGMFNNAPGLGFQLLWRPTSDWSVVTNEYWGHDTLGNASRVRFHSDDSIQYRYYNHPSNSGLSKMAFALTFDLGCEAGGGVQCLSSDPADPAQNFLGIMAYNRFWFAKDKFGLTVGGGAITNPGRYLVLTPPINGATAASPSPYFTQNPGDQFKAWDSSIAVDYMPSQYMTLRLEYIHRAADVPYFAASGGMSGGGTPDLSKIENRIDTAFMVRL